jgi:hypothetical protein
MPALLRVIRDAPVQPEVDRRAIETALVQLESCK